MVDISYSITTICENTLSAHIADVWNNLPNSVVDTNTFSQFKERLDKFWLK